VRTAGTVEASPLDACRSSERKWPDGVTSAVGPEGALATPPMRNLHHSPELEASRAPRASGSVQNLGTSAKLACAPDNPEWTADLEYVWRTRTHEALQRLDQRARRQRRRARTAAEPSERVTLSRSAEWAEHRAQAMALPRAELVATCGKRFRHVRCGCGQREIAVGCDQVQLCARCSRRHWRRWRKRIVRALDAHVRAARGAWAAGERRGRLPGVYMITLTVPHSGSIVDDRATLAAGWRKLSKRAEASGWWGAYALAYEVTPGRDGKGHVHVHIAAVSSWVPYAELREAWQEFTGAVIVDVSPPGRSTRSAKAAEYLAKYVTKGIKPADFTGAKAGELLVAMRGKRRVTTSLRFWRPLRDAETRCSRCREHVASCGAPVALRRVAPGAVLQAMAERIGWWIPRGTVQTKFKGDGL